MVVAMRKPTRYQRRKWRRVTTRAFDDDDENPWKWSLGAPKISPKTHL